MPPTFFASNFSAFLSAVLSAILSAGLNSAKIALDEMGGGCSKNPSVSLAGVALIVVFVTERCGERLP